MPGDHSEPPLPFTFRSSPFTLPPFPQHMPPESRPMSYATASLTTLVMPHMQNVLGDLFGGHLMAMVDQAAAVAAIRHAGGPAVTASIDRVDFREPIHLGDLVVMKSSVNFVGRTSMEVGVRVEAEDLMSGRRRHTNSCYLTFVAVDRNGRPIEVPELLPETPEEQRRFQAATERRARRVEERQQEEAHK
jgi:acyl-CoA hydrolase